LAVLGTSTASDTRPRAETAEAVLELREVSRRFGALTAVDALSLDVRRGEILTLLGPSGCGKTTTLRMIIGLERCDSGQIIYDGRVLDAPRQRTFVPTHKRQMGMVFQSYAIWPHMNVFDNVAYPLRVRGVGAEKLREASMRALEQVGLAAMAQRPATQLSGGQQQRVALARSLVFEPQILLLDEPFSNLDAQLRGQMRAELKLLQRRLGVTVVLVTHDQVEALSVSDRIAVMRQGRVEQLGTPQQLYREPATLHVRDFVGRTIVLNGVARDVKAESVVVTLGTGTEITCRGTASAVLTPGQACDIAVRPEHVLATAAEGHGQQLPNTLSGRIDALLFIGDHYEATITLDLGQVIMAHLSASDEWREGQHVTLSLPAHDIRVWAAA
jgi:ABC-type Fe3+/spermidine/putrescine transport system ATPase subunit